jgi:hypothetical protein
MNTFKVKNVIIKQSRKDRTNNLSNNYNYVGKSMIFIIIVIDDTEIIHSYNFIIIFATKRFLIKLYNIMYLLFSTYLYNTN